MHSVHTRKTVLGLGLIFIMGLLALSSCSPRFELSLDGEGRGSISSQFLLTKEIQSYMKDLAELDPTFNEQLLSEKSLKEGLLSHGALTNPVAKVEDSGRLIQMSFGFSSLASLQEPARIKGIPPIFYLQREKDLSVLTILLNKKNFSALTNLTTLSESAVLEEFLPNEKNPQSAAEYNDLLVYLLEPYSKDPQKILDNSYVDVVINLPRKVLSSSLGKATGNQVTLKIPLVEVLTLDKPIAGTIRY